MPAPFSTVTDNSLLPFATAGSEFIPRNDDGYSPLYAISQVFENGLLMEGSRMTSVMIGTNGEIYLFETATGSGSTSTILPFTLDQDNR
ncbi:MAG: hypothetical protein WAT09_18250, partial [Paracoccaceae bacterium]